MPHLPISLALLTDLEREESIRRERTEKYIFEIKEAKKEFEKMNEIHHGFIGYWPEMNEQKKAKLSSPKWADFRKKGKIKGWQRNKR